MIVLVALTVGLVFWIVAWALGVKGFDAFLFTILITVAAAAVKMTLPTIQRILHGTPDRPE